MRQPLLVLPFLLIFSTFSFAQQRHETSQDSSIIIFSESPRSLKNSKKRHSDENNIIKIAPLGFLKGAVPIYYERRLTDFLTIQGGVGITARNYIRGLVYNVMDEQGSSNNNYEYTWSNGGKDYTDMDELYDFTYRQAKTGYCFSLQPRIYFESEAPDGAFLAFSFDHYQYNFQSKKLAGPTSDSRSNTWVNEYEKMNDLMVDFGAQSLYDRITLEYTFGIGLRYLKGQKYGIASDNNGNYVDGMADYKKTVLNVEMSLKVGFHF